MTPTSSPTSAGFHQVFLYVRDTATSAAFYEKLFGCPPVDQSPGFAFFVTDTGSKLGLWQTGGVEPPPTPAGGGELGFHVANEAQVRERHAAWQGHGVTVLQPPTRMDFGFTFTAADPDGHRLRVFALDDA